MLQLLLPVLFPSWRFFSGIGPSPRVEYAFASDRKPAQQWLEFRPRPTRLSWRDGIARLFYNAKWNEYLYVISCAEHLLENVTTARVDEIFLRLRRACAQGELQAPADAQFISFRIQIVERQGNNLSHTLAFIAGPQPLLPPRFNNLDP